ncbi:HAD-IIIA family hydrolase [Brenneria goodwinii]|uniref:KdsC family phosphatase n=1 Tax=Brenneria goodwinii TaxID=1109412 RepID=UPI0036E06C0F
MASLYQGPIRLVLFDVDGVLTDGSLYLDGQGERLKAFNVRDGLAISLLRAHGIHAGILSGKSSEALDYRIRQLKFDVAVTGRLEKQEAYTTIKRERGLDDAQIAYVGDDVVDLPLAGRVGCFYAPSDAHALVLEAADHVVAACGGRGVARDVAEHVLLAAGLSLQQAYRPLIAQWERYDAVQ